MGNIFKDGGLIHDIIKGNDRLGNMLGNNGDAARDAEFEAIKAEEITAAIEELNSEAAQRALHEMDAQSAAEELDSARLIRILFDRDVTIKDIFGRYYEFEEMASHHTPLTVEDADLAGMVPSGFDPTKADF